MGFEALGQIFFTYAAVVLILGLPAYFIFEVILLWRAYLSGGSGISLRGGIGPYTLVALSFVAFYLFLANYSESRTLYAVAPPLAALLLGVLANLNSIDYEKDFLGFVVFRKGTIWHKIRGFISLFFLLSFAAAILLAFTLNAAKYTGWDMTGLLLFNAGLYAQGYLMMKGRSRIMTFAGIVALSLLASFFGTILDKGSYGAAGYSFVVFTLFFWSAFRDEVLPVISEQTVLFYTLLFWYVFLERFYAEWPITAAAALIPTTATLAASYSKAKTSQWAKLLLYTWFLVIIVFLIYFQITQGAAVFLLMAQSLPPDPLSAFMTGMVSLYFSFYLLTVYMLIPIPGKRQRFADRLEECKKLARSLIGHYSDTQIEAAHATMMILALGAFFAVNHYTGFMPDYLLINLAVILYPLIQSKDLAGRREEGLRKESQKEEREKLKREVLGWMTKED